MRTLNVSHSKKTSESWSGIQSKPLNIYIPQTTSPESPTKQTRRLVCYEGISADFRRRSQYYINQLLDPHLNVPGYARVHRIKWHTNTQEHTKKVTETVYWRIRVFEDSDLVETYKCLHGMYKTYSNREPSLMLQDTSSQVGWLNPGMHC